MTDKEEGTETNKECEPSKEKEQKTKPRSPLRRYWLHKNGRDENWFWMRLREISPYWNIPKEPKK
jgi:hypothetical protein